MSIKFYLCFCVDPATCSAYWEEVVCKFLWDLLELFPSNRGSINFLIQSIQVPNSNGKVMPKAKKWNTLEYQTLAKSIELIKKENAAVDDGINSSVAFVRDTGHFLHAMNTVIWESQLALQSPCKPCASSGNALDERRIIVLIDEGEFFVDDSVQEYFDRNQIFNMFHVSKNRKPNIGNVIELAYEYLMQCRYSSVYFCLVKPVEVVDDHTIFDWQPLNIDSTKIIPRCTLNIESKYMHGFASLLVSQNLNLEVHCVEGEPANAELHPALQEYVFLDSGKVPLHLSRIMRLDEGSWLESSFELFLHLKEEFEFQNGLQDCEAFCEHILQSFQLESTMLKALLCQLHSLYFKLDSKPSILHFLKVFLCLNEVHSECYRALLHSKCFSEDELHFLERELLLESELFDLQSPVPREKSTTELHSKGENRLELSPARNDSLSEHQQFIPNKLTFKSRKEMSRSLNSVRRILESQYASSHGEILLSPTSAGLRRSSRKPAVTVKCTPCTTQLMLLQSRGKKIIVPETPFKPPSTTLLKTPVNNQDEEVFIAETPKKILKCRKKLQF